MTEPKNSQEQLDAPIAPMTWKDIVRQHITGPVFSLAFHIFLLVLLGMIVIVVPNAGKDDVESVQITELEPVLPPPEEEPMPSDMTVMDTSSPSLDRYESDNREMEEVGVTDVPVMSDIEIPTPLTVPDSNSSLKLQGVLPFGRPGGGDMGDGGEGDGRGNLKGMLQGVFYDLKQLKNGRPTDAMGKPEIENDRTRDKVLPVIKEFVNGDWHREYDKQGRVHYPTLDKYYCSPTRLWNSCFYTKQINATEAPTAYQCGKEVNTGGWVCIYSGNIVAPFSGKFRFVGYCDDILVIRFNKEIVFDYGWYSATLAMSLWDMNGRWVPDNSPARGHMEGQDDYHRILNGRPETERHRRMIADSVIYSKHMLDVYFPRFDSNHGIAKGPVLEVQEGEIYPIEILISEVPGGKFTLVLFMEQLDKNGRPAEVQKKLEELESKLETLEQTPQVPREKIAAARKAFDEFIAETGKSAEVQKKLEELESKLETLEQTPQVPRGTIAALRQILNGITDEKGRYTEPDPDTMTLFRTTLDLPEYPSDQPGFPKFKPYGPIWRVVRSDAQSSSGDILRSRGSTVSTKRAASRAEQVTEDDDDLSL